MQWMTEQEVVELLKRRAETIRLNIKSGKWEVRYSAINGRRYMYSAQDIQKLIDQHSNKKRA